MAMQDEGATLGEKALRQIAIGLRDIQRLKKNDRSTGLSANARQANYQVKWDVDIDAATDSVSSPGLGTATIWARESGGDLYDTGRVLDVVNRSESSSYTAGDWGKVERINGEWQPYTGTGGGGGHTMWFAIQDVLCPDGYEITQTTLRVTPLWYTGTCGLVPPGRDEDGYWHVYDICNYLSGQVAEDLPGTIGRATYFYPYTADDYDPPPCVPAWIIDDICAQPECA